MLCELDQPSGRGKLDPGGADNLIIIGAMAADHEKVEEEK